MSRTRDIIQQIADIRARRRWNSAMAELPMRLFSLEQAFKKLEKTEQELIRYFPVALIACVEGYFRMVIKDLIDAGEPYLSNAEKPAASIKLDFSILRAVHGKAVTVGELIAHGVQISRLEHIESAISSIVGASFLQSLQTVTDRWPVEVMGEPKKPILFEPNKIFSDVTRLFELRHIICHELASAYVIEPEELARCFESCVAFLQASDEYVAQTLHPNAPLTQTEMNIAACGSLADREVQMEQAIEKLKARLDVEQLTAFDHAQMKWKEYCDAWTLFAVGNREDSGTIWLLLFASTMEVVVENRRDQIASYRRLGDAA